MAGVAPAGPAGIAPAGIAGAGGGPKIGAVGYKFVHPVDTPQGQDERREHERMRKAAKRDAAKAVAAKLDEPPPLRPVAAGVPGQPAPPGGAVGGPAVDPTFAAGDPPPVPWQPELLNDLLGELMDAAEEGRVAMFAAKCQEAGLLPKLCKQIEADAHFPKAAKIILKRSLPRLACKWLNQTGVSAEYQDEVAVVTALVLVIQHDRKMAGKLDELIAATQAGKVESPKSNVPSPASLS